MPKGVYQRKTTEERFWKKVDVKGDDECWMWLGAKYEKGYGSFWINGRMGFSNRVAYELWHGIVVPNNILVLHRCDVTSCVNPMHLFLGTDRTNAIDMVTKNRHANFSGENHPNSKLKWNEVELIRKLYSEKVFKQRELASIFDVSYGVINHVVNNRNYKRK